MERRKSSFSLEDRNLPQRKEKEASLPIGRVCLRTVSDNTGIVEEGPLLPGTLVAPRRPVNAPSHTATEPKASYDFLSALPSLDIRQMDKKRMFLFIFFT